MISRQLLLWIPTAGICMKSFMPGRTESSGNLSGWVDFYEPEYCRHCFRLGESAEADKNLFNSMKLLKIFLLVFP
jgi:hypothetical protein